MTAKFSRITPNIWCDGTAEAAAQYYVELFGTDAEMTNTTSYPQTGLLDFQAHMAGLPLTVDFRIANQPFTVINAGDEFTPNPAISFMLNFDPLNFPDADAARAELQRVWHGLADGGQVFVPLQAYDFSPWYGWVQDRFGVSWQLILTDPNGEPRPFIIPTLTFGGVHQNNAAEAVDYWTALFPDAHTGVDIRYGQPQGTATADGVRFRDFTLAGQWFAALDSPEEQDFTFTEGLSLLVACEDQAEIDRYWAALSAVPEAEQCGWCRDHFGVSWQIVPKNIGDLVQRPGAYQRLMGMQKIVIAEF